MLRDSLLQENTPSDERFTAFYDSLKYREHKSWVIRMLTNWLIRDNDGKLPLSPEMELERAQRYYDEFAGKIITKIDIIQANVFENKDFTEETGVAKFINSLHILTKRRNIEKNLLFHIDNPLDPYTMVVNERLLRRLPYLAESFILIAPNSDVPGTVAVTVFARDSWTIGVEADLSNHPWGKVFDANFLGSGNELSIRYYPKLNEQMNTLQIAYSLNNFLGTFANVDASLGVGAIYNNIFVSAERPFILPSDHFFGLYAGNTQNRQSFSIIDTSLVINASDYSLWYGYSFNLGKRKGANLYLASSFDYRKFNKRPETNAATNPYFHNKQSWLFSIGISQQNYFQGNMILGIGRIEDVPYGFNVDFTGGLRWDEYIGRRYYVGASAKWGNNTAIGYFGVGASATTFIDDSGTKSQGEFGSYLTYFSPLFKCFGFYARNYLEINYTNGWNRLDGEKERIVFSEFANVRGMRIPPDMMGLRRMTINFETALFSPLSFYFFNFTSYIWADVGWLGCEQNVFENPFYSAVGVGLNIRNERLIFNSLIVRLGVNISKPSQVGFNPLSIALRQRINMPDFTPTRPKATVFN